MVPTGIADEELAKRYPQMFKVGDPIGYVRPYTQQRPKKKDRKNTMANEETEMQDELVDGETGEVTEKKTRKPRAKRGTAVKAEKPAKAKWTPSAELLAAGEALSEFARRGDKKSCAWIVKHALATRDLCKATLDSGDDLPGSDDDVASDTDGDVVEADDDTVESE